MTTTTTKITRAAAAGALALAAAAPATADPLALSARVADMRQSIVSATSSAASPAQQALLTDGLAALDLAARCLSMARAASRSGHQRDAMDFLGAADAAIDRAGFLARAARGEA